MNGLFLTVSIVLSGGCWMGKVSIEWLLLASEARLGFESRESFEA
jgi:hypothetical protein